MRERHAGALTSGYSDTQPLPLAEKPTQDNYCPGEHPLGNGGQHSCWPVPPMPLKFKQGGPPGQSFTHPISTALQGLSTSAHRWFPGPEPSLSQVQVRQEVLCRLLHGPQLTPARGEGAGTLCQFLPVVFIGPRATSPAMALHSRGPESMARQLGLKPDAWRGCGSIPELDPPGACCSRGHPEESGAVTEGDLPTGKAGVGPCQSSGQHCHPGRPRGPGQASNMHPLPGRIRVLELWFSSTSHSVGRRPQRGPLSTHSVSIHTLSPGECE